MLQIRIENRFVNPQKWSPHIPQSFRAGRAIDEVDLRVAREFKKVVQRKDIHKDSDSEDDDMGPMPLVNPDSNANAFSNQNQNKWKAVNFKQVAPSKPFFL